MLFLVVYTVFLPISLLFGFFIWKKLSSEETVLRLTAALLPAAILNLTALFFFKIKEAYFYDPNWERLQNAFALAAGDAVYYGLNQGPVLNTMYGPVAVLAFCPAALAHAPVSVMAIASCLGVFYFFAPFFYLYAAGFRKRKIVVSLFAIIFFAAITHFSSPLRNAAFRIHADAPALGLGALACVILILRRKDGILGLSLAALAAVLSVWAKQVMVPVIAATSIYLWISEGSAVLKRYILWIFAWGILVSAIFVFLFGAQPLFINMFYIPGRHALREGGLLESILKLLRECLLPLTAIVIFFPVFRGLPWKKPAALIRQNRWALFLLTALFLIPTSILGNAKLGGSNNTLSYTVYFLLAGFTLAIADSKDLHEKARFSMAFVLILLLAIQIPSVYYRYRKIQKFKDYPSSVFNYIKNNPEKGFFPRLNVLSIMNNEKNYHSSCGVIDRKWANIPFSREHLHAHLPAKMEFMAFREDFNDDKEFFDLPDFWYKTTDPELPEFRIYRRKN